MRDTARQRWLLLFGLVPLLATLACVVTPTSDGGADANEPCAPGAGRSCACPEGGSGTQLCNSTGTGFGVCACAGSTCALAAGAPCTATEQCCPIGGAPAVCANLPGAGRVCARRCSAHSQCDTGCCGALADGTIACTVARWCAAVGTCTSAVGESCSSDDQCCPDAVGGLPSACASGSAGSPACSTLCTDNGNCLSSCCRARSDGLRVCRPTAECS